MHNYNVNKIYNSARTYRIYPESEALKKAVLNKSRRLTRLLSEKKKTKPQHAYDKYTIGGKVYLQDLQQPPSVSRSWRRHR